MVLATALHAHLNFCVPGAPRNTHPACTTTRPRREFIATGAPAPSSSVFSSWCSPAKTPLPDTGQGRRQPTLRVSQPSRPRPRRSKGRRGAQQRGKAVWKACLRTEAKAMQPSWARYPSLSVSTPAGADFPTQANLCAPEDSRWDSSSPCADDMQTDSPSNITTPVAEGRYGMEVSFLRLEQYACRAATAMCKGAF